jgi:hypothetical protein
MEGDVETQPAPWWKRVDDAAQLITSTVNAAASRAGRDGVYAPPRGAPPPRRKRRAASLRHLAEVIRTHRMAPGVAVDKDVVARVLAGDPRYLSDPVAVVAVARASHHIAGQPFGEDEVQRLTVAVDHLNALLEAAREADRRAPDLLPVRRPPSALIEREADRGRTAWHEAEVIGVARPMTSSATLAGPSDPPLPSRRPRLRLGPTSWAVLLAVFAAGVLVGVTGSRLADTLQRGTPARSAACLPSGDSRPAGSVVMGPPGTPAGTSMRPNWWANAVTVGLTPTPTGFVAVVPAGPTLPHELLAIRSGITLTAGHRYRFDFTATGDRPVTILLRIQDKAPPLYRPALVESAPIGPAPCRRSYTFTADATSPATGEVTFQLGGQGAYTLTVNDAVLVDTGT